jgi:hypothetical protein
MSYKEYYHSKAEIKAADPITREAFVIASTMYEPHWGWKDNMNCMTEKKLPIVYAFNIAETFKESITDSTDRTSAIKNLFKKNEFNAINWAYQRNTILGILYYILAFTENITIDDLRSLESQATHLMGINNERGAIYLNVFKDAVTKKHELEEEKESTSSSMSITKIDVIKAQMLFHYFFRDGLDMDKIKNGLESLLNKRTLSGNYLFSQQRHWFVVYMWFLEIGFITKQKQGEKFRLWAISMFGNKGYSTTYDFEGAARIYKGNILEWNPIDKHEEFISIRDYLSEIFSKEKRNDYLIDGKFIYWNLNIKQ